MPLNAMQLKSLPAGEHGDGRGLYLIVEPTKTDANRRFAFRWSAPDGTRPWKNIGPIDRITLTQARKTAGQWFDMVRDGKDPRSTVDTGGMTLKAFVNKHLDRWTKNKCESERKNWHRSIAAMAPLYNEPIATITPEQVLTWISPLWEDKTIEASRTLTRLAKIFRGAIAMQVREKANPASWDVMGEFLTSARELAPVKHHEAMPHADVPALVKKLSYETTNTARCVLFTILTALRSQETREARWSWLNDDMTLMTVPGEFMKRGKEHLVVLSEQATELLRSMPRTTARIFPSQKGLDRCHDVIRPQALVRTLDRIVDKHVTLHGFRSSFKVWVTEKTPMEGDVAECALAHRIAKTPTEEAYLRSAPMLDKRRVMMQAWADFCTGAVPTAALLPFKREAA
jgi:integrase